MKVKTVMNVVAVSCMVWLAGITGAFAQGSLTPPGTPEPTMKTLDQIEPRTPVSSTPYTINTPGSYYLTTNLTGVAGQVGITITADGVALDLNGYILEGVTNSSFGIRLSSGLWDNISIRNGSVCGWGSDGINAANAHNSLFVNLMVCSNSSRGLSIGDGCVVKECIVQKNGNEGILGGSQNLIVDCISRNNGYDGINMQNRNTIRNCRSDSNGGDGMQMYAENTVEDCTSGFNGGYGICTLQSSCCFVRNTCFGHSYAGIYVEGGYSRVEENHCFQNATGIDISDGNNIVIKNSCAGNTTTNYSIAAGNVIGEIVNAVGGAVVSNANSWANFSF